MKFQWRMLLVLSLLVSGCGKRSETPAPAGPLSPGAADRPAAAEVAEAAPPSVAVQDSLAEESGPFAVKEVRLVPETPTCSTPITAEPVYSGSLPEGTDFQYEWVVNNAKVPGTTGPVLAPEAFKKKAWVSCRVTLSGPGGADAEVRSQYVRIANSRPELTLPATEPFQAPGRLELQFRASDADNDPVSFKLVSPLDQGIVLDEKSGALTWEITAEIVKSLTGTVEIIVAALDGDGGEDRRSLTFSVSDKQG